MKRIQLDGETSRVFENTISAMVEFKRVFGKHAQPATLGELYAAKELGLEVNPNSTQPGFDAIDIMGKRYEVKERSLATRNVDVNNFDFDYIVLVNLDDKYQLAGMWRATVTQAKEIFTRRGKFRKYQVTQKKFKSIVECLI